MDENIVWHAPQITRQDRQKLLNQSAKLLWFTGYSGSGKSTVAGAAEAMLNQQGVLTYLLDGDNIRHGLSKDLRFSAADRTENIRRIGEVSGLFVDAGLIVLATFISPFREDRQQLRDKLKDDFVEVFVKCPIDTCEARDPKGLYKKARRGEIPNFTGVDQAYEEPENPELVIDTSELSVEESAKQVLDYLRTVGGL